MSTKTRVTKPVAAAVSEAAYEEALGRYTANASKSKVIIAKSEAKIKAEMDKRNVALGNMPKEMEEDYDTVFRYCEANKEKMFGENKTVPFFHGTLNYRTSPHALVTGEDGKAVEKAMIAAFKKKGLGLYVKVTEALDKKKIISDREDKAVVKILEAAGASVEQAEVFSIALN